MEYYGKLQAEGRIESFEPVILTAHGGDLYGFFLIKGDADKLSEIRREDDFLNFTTHPSILLKRPGLPAAK